MKSSFFSPAPETPTVRDWLEAIQEQFRLLSNETETGIIAAYHALITVQETAGYEADQMKIRTRAKIASEAAKARMEALVTNAADKMEQKRLRKVFFAATQDYRFRRFVFWY